MSGRSKSSDPEKRMGVYKRLAAVPDRYRLYHHASAYDDRDIWADYLETYLFASYEYNSERFRQVTNRTEKDWKEHMDGCGRHHALATPADVEAWCAALLNRMTAQTAYSQYWVRVEDFYTWLQNHPGHPHVYQPVLMAAAQYPAAGEIWASKLNTANRSE